MEENKKNYLLDGAIEIGNDILDKAIIDSNGIYWKTIQHITFNGDVKLAIDESIYSGVSGILLFYIELYKQTEDEKYLQILIDSGKWLISYCTRKSPTHGFFAGTLGCVITLFKITEISKDSFFKNEALKIAEHFKDVLYAPPGSFNLFDGLGGTLLGLLHLHSLTNIDWILKSLEVGVFELLKCSKSNNVGLYWDSFSAINKSSTQPLSSFPFGSAGIGFLFSQFSTYFNNPNYQFVADQAFLYDAQFLNWSSEGTPDFHFYVGQKEFNLLKRAYFQGKKKPFIVNKFSINWLYGATGIAFSRLSNNNSLGKYRDNLLKLSNLIQVNIENGMTNFTLSTGKAGSAMFLYEFDKLNESNLFQSTVSNVAKASLAQRHNEKFYRFGFDCAEDNEDESLFMGSAGIGYFYLYLNNSETSDCILMPKLMVSSDVPSDTRLKHLHQDELTEIIFNNWYPLTLNILKDKIGSKIIKIDFSKIKQSLNFELEKISNLHKDKNLKEAFEYENIQSECQSEIANNYGLFTLSTKLENDRSQTLLKQNSDKTLFKSYLEINPYCKIISTKWDTESYATNIYGETLNIVYSAQNGNKYKLNEIEHILLGCFKKPRKVESIYKLFIKTNKFTGEDLKQAKIVYINQIKAFLNSGFLIIAQRQNFIF